MKCWRTTEVDEDIWLYKYTSLDLRLQKPGNQIKRKHFIKKSGTAGSSRFSMPDLEGRDDWVSREVQQECLWQYPRLKVADKEQDDHKKG